MAVFSRDPLMVAAATLGLGALALLAAYAYGAASVDPTTGGLVAAAAAVLIAGAGILYAWRQPGR
jgi:hypothetical protein